MLPAKHSFGKCDRRTDRQTDGRTDRQTDGQSDPYVSLCFAGDTKTICYEGTFNRNSTFATMTYHNVQHRSVTKEQNVPIPKLLCHVQLAYFLCLHCRLCSILQHSTEDYVNIRKLHSMYITVVNANMTAQQFPPHFCAFPQLSPHKIPPFGRCRLQTSYPGFTKTFKFSCT